MLIQPRMKEERVEAWMRWGRRRILLWRPQADFRGGTRGGSWRGSGGEEEAEVLASKEFMSKEVLVRPLVVVMLLLLWELRRSGMEQEEEINKINGLF